MKNIEIKSGNLPIVLAIIDGWGVRPGQPQNDDPTAVARIPFLRKLEKEYPHALLGASGKDVGLPSGQAGNSEAGHLNLGAGRIVEQDAVYISNSIKDGTFFKNPALLNAIKHVKRHHSRLHLMGLLSNYNSGHASPDHLHNLLRLANENKIEVFLHLFTDGRDSPRYDALKFLHELELRLKPGQVVATICGRFYAMDRKKDWTRTGQTYKLLTEGAGVADTSAEEAIRHAYNRGENDEYLTPTVITDARHRPLGTIRDGDSIIFFNLRSDRARQLSKPFVQKKFEAENSGSFKRKIILKNLRFVALTDFGPDLDDIVTAFPSRDVKNALPVALMGLKQFYVAESEKFAHITYFLNGGYDKALAGETRLMLPSPKVASYDRVPQMSAYAITKKVTSALKKRQFDFVGINFANADMVGHTGNAKACVKAMEVIDDSLKTIAKALPPQGLLMVTADHGNVEKVIDPKTGEVDTEHSINPVRLLMYGQSFHYKQFRKRTGILADVAPTILKLFGRPQPKEMTGKSLL